MKLVCPECGMQGDLVAFLIDGEARVLAVEFARLPPELGTLAVRYLGLFKPKGRAIALNKAARLLRELADAVTEGKVARHGRAWTAGTGTWRQAFETMLDARERLTLPLKTHGYLFEIVTGLADRAEAEAERALETRRQRGQHRAEPPQPAAEKPADPALARTFLGEALAKLRGGANDA